MKIRSIQLSIILGFTLLIVITILTIGALSFYLFNDTLRRNSLDNTSQVITQLNRVIDNYISYMDDISLVVIYNNDVQNYVSEASRREGFTRVSIRRQSLRPPRRRKSPPSSNRSSLCARISTRLYCCWITRRS